MKTISLFFSLFLISFFAGAIGPDVPVQNIRGSIIDKVSKTSLPGASVIILNSKPLIGTTSDIDGNFRLNKVDIGRVTLKITFLGYKEVVLSNLSLSTGKELFLEIEMEENVIMQTGIEIKATKDKSLTNNEMTTVSARGFTVEETQRYAGSRNDVARMASNFAGIAGAGDARNDIIIRGNSPIGLLWRMEGIDIPNPNHYGSPTSTGGPVCMINNNVLSNSDFLMGAFPAEYGNANSGVFDLKMRNGNNEKHEFLGQVGFNGVEAGAEGPIDKSSGSSYITNYRYSTLSVLQAMGADLGTGTGVPYFQDGTFKLNFPKTKIGSIAVFGIGGVSDIKVWDSKVDTTKEHTNFYEGEGFDLTNGAQMFSGGIIHTVSVNKNAFFKSYVSASYHRFKTTLDSLTPENWDKICVYNDDFIETTFSASVNYIQKFSSRSNIKTGISLKNMGFDLSEGMLFRTYDEFRSLSDFSGSSYLIQPYFQYQYKFNEKVTLNTGLHYQYFTFNSTSSLEPRLGLKWEYASNRSLNFGYGYHSQLLPISVYYRQALMPDGQYRMLNKDLDMTHSQHFVVSHDWSVKENLRLKTEAYYQNITGAAVNKSRSNYYSLINEGANFGFLTPDSLKTTGTGSNLGFEITLEHFLNKGLYYLFTVSLYDSKYKGSDGIERNTAFNGNYIANALVGKEFELGSKIKKDKKVTNTLGFDLKANLAGGQRYVPFTTELNPLSNNTSYRQVFDYQNAYTERFKDYFRTDLKISYRRNGKHITQEWVLDIQNLFGTQNIFSERFNTKTGEKSYIYQTGRMIIPQYKIIF